MKHHRFDPLNLVGVALSGLILLGAVEHRFSDVECTAKLPQAQTVARKTSVGGRDLVPQHLHKVSRADRVEFQGSTGEFHVSVWVNRRDGRVYANISDPKTRYRVEGSLVGGPFNARVLDSHKRAVFLSCGRKI